MSVVAINHVGISVADLERAQRFWCDGLGALDHGGWSWPVGTAPADESLATANTAAAVALLRTDTAFMELFAFTAPTPRPRPVGVPGVSALTWAVGDVPQTLARAVAAGGSHVSDSDVRCPDGTLVSLVERPAGEHGLVGVRLQVQDPGRFVITDVPGPVELTVEPGASQSAAAAADLGANHICVDVNEIAATRAGLSGVVWHHDVTESSGGIAAVSYGTTADGVLIELLESRSPEAFLSRCRLAHPG